VKVSLNVPAPMPTREIAPLYVPFGPIAAWNEPTPGVVVPTGNTAAEAGATFAIAMTATAATAERNLVRIKALLIDRFPFISKERANGQLSTICVNLTMTL
jgi:hypothetical protein